MHADDRVLSLLSVWRQAREEGRPLAVEELCREAPDLLPAVAEAIAAVDQLGRLAAPDPTADLGESSGPSPGGRDRPPADPPDPARIGDYRVVRRLGRGGMGTVYAADDPRLGRRVAVKVMRPEVSARPGYRERFLREARAAAAVEHDHVVPVYQAGEDGGELFLVMPLLAGESLEDRLRREPALPVAAAARVGAEVAAGLAAAHDRGLVHRDVKPANVWLEGGPADAARPGGFRRCRVLDFGLARPAERSDLTASGAVLGTAAYMAPEQADGLAVDHRADLFALGAVLYRCLTGAPAFDGPTLTAVLKAVALHDPPPHRVNPAVPRGLSDLVLRLLAKDPNDRPATAAAVAAELAAVAAGGADTVHSGPTAEMTPRPRRARRLVVACAVVMGLCLVAAVGSRAFVPGKGDGPPAGGDGPPPAAADVPAAYRGSVDLLVYRRDAGSDVLVPLGDPRAMPLRPGDQVKLAAEVEPPAFVYLFWIDETGAAAPAYPWRFGEWGTRPTAERPVGALADVRWPGGEALKITGEAAGTETVLMLVRSSKLDAADDEVKGWFAGLRPVPFRGETARAWFQDFDLLRSDRLRAPGMADLDAADGPRGLMAELRRRAGGSAAFSRAVSFSRAGAR